SRGQRLVERLRVDGVFAGADARVQRFADQERERVAVLRHPPGLRGDVHLGLTPRRLRAMQVDLARYAGVEAQLREVERLLLAVARAFREPQQFAIGDQRQPRVR